MKSTPFPTSMVCIGRQSLMTTNIGGEQTKEYYCFYYNSCVIEIDLLIF